MLKNIKKLSKKKLGFLLGAVLILLTVIGIVIGSHFNTPRMRVLKSVFHFSSKTLKSPDYLFYNIDVMELMHQYFNSDVAYTGDVSMHNIKDLGVSVAVSVDGIRSFEQKKMSLNGSLSVLHMKVCDVNMYADENTVYLYAPIVNVSNAVPVDVNLFPKMPDLTSDINKSWFDKNKKNIKQLSKEIFVEQTGNTITDENGVSADEFFVTIPQGKGEFIYKLLGMSNPDHDVTVQMYLTKDNHMSRMVIDLSHEIPGASLTIDGTDVGTLIFDYPLPDNEHMVLTIDRNGKRSHWFDVVSTYHTKTGEDYLLTGVLTWENSEAGFDIKFKDVVITLEDEVYGEMFFEGTITPLEQTPDVFTDTPTDLSSMETITWEELRDQTTAYIENMLGVLQNFFF